MKKLHLKVLSLSLIASLCLAPVSVFASEAIDQGEAVNSESDLNDSADDRDVQSINYYQDSESLATGAGGGTLTSYTEREKMGSSTGNVKKYKFYLYSKYTGTKTVEKISAVWTVTAKMRNSCTLTLNTSLSNNSASISAGASTSYQNKSLTKSWTNTNGSKAVYEDTNFTCAPKSDLSGNDVSVTTVSSIKLKGDAKTYSISSGC